VTVRQDGDAWAWGVGSRPERSGAPTLQPRTWGCNPCQASTDVQERPAEEEGNEAEGDLKE
jgi:hypothetical protein